jgi:hypothetical protein
MWGQTWRMQLYGLEVKHATMQYAAEQVKGTYSDAPSAVWYVNMSMLPSKSGCLCCGCARSCLLLVRGCDSHRSTKLLGLTSPAQEHTGAAGHNRTSAQPTHQQHCSNSTISLLVIHSAGLIWCLLLAGHHSTPSQWSR